MDAWPANYVGLSSTTSIKANGPSHASHNHKLESQRDAQAHQPVKPGMSSPQRIQLGHPRAYGRGAAAEAHYDAFEGRAGDCVGTSHAADDGAGVLQIVTHACDDHSEDVDAECAKREGWDAGVQGFGEVEAQEGPWRCEGHGEVGAVAPGGVDGPDAQQDGAEPTAPAQKDGEWVEESMHEGCGKAGEDVFEARSEVGAGFEGGDTDSDLDDEDGEHGFEGVAAVAVLDSGGWDGVVG